MSDREKQVQLSEKFFVRSMMLLRRLEGYELDEKTKGIANDLQDEIDAKIERQERRTLYTAYKQGDTENKKEYFRQKYLEKAGIHEDWRY